VGGVTDADVLIIQYESALLHLDHATNSAVGDLVRLAEDYAALSSLGSVSAHVEKATRLLEQRNKNTEQNVISNEQLKKMQDSPGRDEPAVGARDAGRGEVAGDVVAKERLE
jgi:hypothetical protein